MKTTKKKAEELVIKFKSLAHCDWHSQTGYDMQQGLENAKQCAIICCEEIIDTLDNVLPMCKEKIEQSLYWNHVIQEIEKL